MNRMNNTVELKNFVTNFGIDVTPSTPAYKVKVISKDTIAGLSVVRDAIISGEDLASTLAGKPQVYVAFDGAYYEAGDFVTLFHENNGVSSIRLGVVVESGYTYDDVLKTARHTIIGGVDLPCVEAKASEAALERARDDFFKELYVEDQHRRIIKRIAGNKDLIDRYNAILVAQGQDPVSDADILVATVSEEEESATKTK